jgi:uncharacterized protein YjdB
VTIIEEEAFRGCGSLITVNLPAATIIIDKAFQSCSSLTTVNLPAATDIGDYAFYNCGSLTELTLPDVAPTLGGTNVFSGVNTADLTIFVPNPANASSSYSASGWPADIHFEAIPVPPPPPPSGDDDFIVPVPVAAITLDQTTLALTTGGTMTLKFTITPAGATYRAVTWKSGNEQVAAVDKDGKVTAVGPGVATITVTTADGGKTATCTVTVSALVAVAGVTLDQTSATLKPGASITLVAAVEPSNATNRDVTWKSSNESVASVDVTGKVTAVAPGVATITVVTADGGKTAACAVTVAAPVAVTGVTLDRTSATLKPGASITLVAAVAPPNAASKDVTWKSSNAPVASVDATGKVTAAAPGVATITVTTVEGGKTAICAITVSSTEVVIDLSERSGL